MQMMQTPAYPRDCSISIINELKPVFLCASGNKKLIQITKNIWLFLSKPKTQHFEYLNLAIKTLEIYEGLREAKNFGDLWEVTPIRSKIELLGKIAFKVTYISTSLMNLTHSEPYLQSLITGMNLCCWMLMVEDSKQKLQQNEFKNDRTSLKYDLVTSRLEVIYNVSSIIFPVLIECDLVIISSFALRNFFSLTPIVLNIAAKTSGIASIIYKAKL